jgi:chemotaxis signal transduction protein
MTDAGASAETGIDLVTFRVAGRLFGVEAAQVRSSHPAASRPEDAGDAAVLFGLSAAPRAAAGHVLTIRDGDEGHLLFIETPPELRTLTAAAIHPLPDLLAARTRLPQLRAMALVDGEMMALVDLRTDSGA